MQYFSETQRVRCGEDGAGRRNSEPIAYGATSGVDITGDCEATALEAEV